jgi:hypothetical protein
MARATKGISGALLFLALAWVFTRPRTVRCPQCGGAGAPPLLSNNGWRARICATCGVSSTPDLPLVGEDAPAEVGEEIENG